jgi:hypothetical protein
VNDLPSSIHNRDFTDGFLKFRCSINEEDRGASSMPMTYTTGLPADRAICR